MSENREDKAMVKVAVGLVVRDFISPSPLDKFLDNAQKYNHKIDSLIIAYSRLIDLSAVASLKSRVNVYLIKINDNKWADSELKKQGISERSRRTLLYCDALDESGLVPYGFNRNNVLIEAILTGMDVLIFVDSDVMPGVLEVEDGKHKHKEVDFVGRHMAVLRRGATYASGEYSGYNILPPAYFKGMEDLLIGLGKEDMIEYWLASEEHDSLSYQKQLRHAAMPTKKVLGGNMSIRLDEPDILPPFYSPHYYIGKELYLARGEDTLISMSAGTDGISCLDVDTKIIHDTYGDYPSRPDLRTSTDVQDRFFYACTGWIGRNPLMYYLEGRDLKEVRAHQAHHLEIGAEALASYTGNDIFRLLPKAFERSWNNLGFARQGYYDTYNAWEEFKERRRVNCAY